MICNPAPHTWQKEFRAGGVQQRGKSRSGKTGRSSGTFLFLWKSCRMGHAESQRQALSGSVRLPEATRRRDIHLPDQTITHITFPPLEAQRSPNNGRNLTKSQLSEMKSQFHAGTQRSHGNGEVWVEDLIFMRLRKFPHSLEQVASHLSKIR